MNTGIGWEILKHRTGQADMIGIIYTFGENERKRRKPQREVQSEIEREIDRETEGEAERELSTTTLETHN